MTEIAEFIAQATELLARAAAMPVAGLSDGDLVDLVQDVERAGRLVDGLRCAAAAEVEHRSDYARGESGLAYANGHQRASVLLAQLTRVGSAEVARRIRLGSAMHRRIGLLGDPLPPRREAIASAVERGDVGMDAALAIERVLVQAERAHADPEHIAGAERELVASASVNPAEFVREQGLVWRDWLDPDGAEPREEAIHEQRWLRLGRERNGLTPIRGELDQEFAALMHAAFTESLSRDAAPRFLSDADRAAGSTSTECEDGTVVTSVEDPRSPDQRRHDVLLGLLTAGLRADCADGSGMRPLATITATITLEELATQRGVGLLEGVDESVSAATIAALACDSGFRFIVTDRLGIPRCESAHLRLFTAAQRRALALRDGGCAWPGCKAPPSQCHAHHMVYFSRHGPTTVENGVLLCPAHHRMLHRSGFEFRLVDGRPRLVAPRGVDPGRMPPRTRWHRGMRSSGPPPWVAGAPLAASGAPLAASDAPSAASGALPSAPGEAAQAGPGEPASAEANRAGAEADGSTDRRVGA